MAIPLPSAAERPMSATRLVAAMTFAATFAVTVASLRAQSTTDLGKRLARSKYALGRIVALHELADGRIVVSDGKEGVFRLVDLNKGDVGLIGKQGDEPENYRAASSIFALPGDSLALFDPLGRKVLHVSGKGEPGAMIPWTVTSGTRMIAPTISDTIGNLYYSVVQIDTVAKVVKPFSIVHQYNVASGTDLTLTPVNNRATSQIGNGLWIFPYRDAWAVRSDGLVARVVADSYQVIWFRDGKEAGRSGPLPYAPIAISPAEQQAITDSIHQIGKSAPVSAPMGGAPQQTFIGGGGGGTTVVFSGGGMAIGGAGVAIDRMAGPPGSSANGQAPPSSGAPVRLDPSTIPIAPFPANKPPIVTSGTAASFDNNGLLWVAREHARGDLIPHFDIIAQDRGLVGHVNLPAGTRLVGFGKGVVYLARAEDGSDWLEKYPAPKM